MQGNQGRNSGQEPEGRNWYRGQGGTLLTDLFPRAWLALLSYSNKGQQHRCGLGNGAGPSHPFNNQKKKNTNVWRPIWWVFFFCLFFPNEVPYFQHDSSLCQVDMTIASITHTHTNISMPDYSICTRNHPQKTLYYPLNTIIGCNLQILWAVKTNFFFQCWRANTRAHTYASFFLPPPSLRSHKFDSKFKYQLPRIIESILFV